MDQQRMKFPVLENLSALCCASSPEQQKNIDSALNAAFKLGKLEAINENIQTLDTLKRKNLETLKRKNNALRATIREFKS